MPRIATVQQQQRQRQSRKMMSRCLRQMSKSVTEMKITKNKEKKKRKRCVNVSAKQCNWIENRQDKSYTMDGKEQKKIKKKKKNHEQERATRSVHNYKSCNLFLFFIFFFCLSFVRSSNSHSWYTYNFIQFSCDVFELVQLMEGKKLREAPKKEETHTFFSTIFSQRDRNCRRPQQKFVHRCDFFAQCYAKYANK